MISNSNDETDKKLAAWLKKIMPALEKELSEGPTPARGTNSHSNDKQLKVEEYQDIDLRSHFSSLENFSADELNKGGATWLSISTQDSPVLVLSCSFKSDERTSAIIVVFEPRRSKTDAKLYWHELASIPVRESIEFLVTNPQNRDMFAGASAAGDICIWSYNNAPSVTEDSRIIEVFTKASEDSIVSLAFLGGNRLLCCQSDSRIIVYKVTGKQSALVDKIIKIEPRNSKDPLVTSMMTLPETEDDFVVGLFDGSLLLCSLNQLMPQEENFNPILRELQSHQFAISSLQHCEHKKRLYIVSCDLSGEICFHEIDDKTPKLIVKLPLPLKNKIVLSKNMERIFCPIEKGSLEVFRTNNNSRETVIEGKLGGSGNIAELSRNE